MRFPEKRKIEYKLSQGASYAEAYDDDQRNIQEFNKYANFKLTTIMSDNTENNNKRLTPDELNRETFTWRTKNKEVKLDEMDLDFKLAAYGHALGLANKNFSRMNYHERKHQKFKSNTSYFMKLCDILEMSMMEEHNLPEAPTEVSHVKAMREMIQNGTISGDNLVTEATGEVDASSD